MQLRGGSPGRGPSNNLWKAIGGLIATLAALAAIITFLDNIGVIHLLQTQTAPTPLPPTATFDPIASLYARIHAQPPSISADLSHDTLGWVTGPGARGGTCTFEHNALHAQQGVNGNVTDCISQEVHATNYAIEVSEELNAGYSGGIAYRVGAASYRFAVSKEGTVDFVSDSGPPTYDTPTLFTANINGSAAIGTHQDVTVFSVVQGNQFSFWVDREYLGQVSVTPLANTGDNVGLFAYCQGSPADVAFQGLSIWNL